MFVFRVSFTVAVTNLDANDFTINAGNATAVVTSVEPVVPGRVLATRRLVAAHAWDVMVAVTGNFAATPIILGLADGGTEPRNQAVPATGQAGDPHVSQYAPVEVAVSPGELLTQAGFATTLGFATSLTVLDVTLDFGDAGVTNVTVGHFVVDSPAAAVSVQVSPVGLDGFVPTQLWTVLVTIEPQQLLESRVRLYLDNAAATIVPPPATRALPVLDVTYRPPSTDSMLPLATAAMIAAGVVLCGVCVCGVLLWKSHHRGRAYTQGKSRVAPEPAPGRVAVARASAPVAAAPVTPTGEFAPVIRDALQREQRVLVAGHDRHNAWGVMGGDGDPTLPPRALVPSPLQAASSAGVAMVGEPGGASAQTHEGGAAGRLPLVPVITSTLDAPDSRERGLGPRPFPQGSPIGRTGARATLQPLAQGR